MLFVVERREKGKKEDNWNFWIWAFFVQKWPFRDAYLFFKKCLAETPIFIVFFGCALFGQVVKKGNFGHPPKTKRNLIDNWKARSFGIFYFVFLFFFVLFFCFFIFLVFLGPKPSLFIIFCFFVLFFPFLSLLLNTKTLFFSPRKGHFLFIFECLPLFLLSFFGIPLFNFSFSVSLLFLSFFLPSCLSFLLSLGSLFLSLSFLFFFLCFCFMKGTTSKY